MVKFLEKYILSNVVQKYIVNPKSLIIMTEVKSVINHLPRSRCSYFQVLPNAKGIYILVLHKFFQKIKKVEIKKGEYPPINL